ncbi:unnamed protein product [Protopolystoma xenopodis]|uniref:Uncharacterized protein n=1 Tax=Protopolystoma xenopodis TaxID=117903 RepID=A0A3S5CLZ1_9PLAT|nr:unnamed protein product [Protopolystoma xenopodis]
MKANTAGAYPPQPTGFTNPGVPVSSGAYEDIMDVKYNGGKPVGFNTNGQQSSVGVFAAPQSSTVTDACKATVSGPQPNSIQSAPLTQSVSVAPPLPVGLQVPTSVGSSGGFPTPQTQHQFGGPPNSHIFGFYPNASVPGGGPTCVPSGAAGAGTSVTGHHIPGNACSAPDPSQSRPASSASASHMNAMVAAVLQQHHSQVWILMPQPVRNSKVVLKVIGVISIFELGLVTNHIF